MRPSNLWIVRLSEHLSDPVYRWVRTLPYLDRSTLGLQILKSADSITANIVEGFGRSGAADKLRFYYFARGSSEETLSWLRRAQDRKTIDLETGARLLENYRKLAVSLQAFIRAHESSNGISGRR